MKWRKFNRFFRDNPDFRPLIGWHMGSPCFGTTGTLISDPRVRDHVENKMKHIAFSPFENLGLNMKCHLPTEEGNGMIVTFVTIAVRYHIEGEENLGDRLASVVPEDGPNTHEGTTIQEVIDAKKAWHQIYWAKQGKALVFHSVIVRTRTERRTGRFGSECVSEHLDIYRFPASYRVPGTVPAAATA